MLVRMAFVESWANPYADRYPLMALITSPPDWKRGELLVDAATSIGTVASASNRMAATNHFFDICIFMLFV